MFVAIALDRGFVTVTIAHITFSMCYVAVVVQSRLVSFDRSIEEAAMDLGCPPARTFFQITLPIIAPAVIAGWLLSFRSDEHTSELQSLMRTPYAVFCLTQTN